ncbi:MAG TPA: metal-dependent hydrolase [Vicinamibacterales bacterium]|nr:metal-dependent hydrolase [Vicinamibacterales bacterium]
MDNLTHTLFGFTLSRTPLERAGRGTTAALLLASNAPDIDIVTALHGGRLAYLADHRDATHGVLGGLLLAAATAAIVRLWYARPWRRTPARVPDDAAPGRDASFPALLGVSLIGVLFHLLMDLATPYGTRILSPFSGTWYAFDWMPVIDIYLWAILIACTIMCLVRPAQRRRIAAAALVLTLGLYAVRATAHQAALHQAAAEVAAEGIAPCTPGVDPARAPLLDLASWSDRPAGKIAAPAAGAAMAAHPGAPACLVQMAALPTYLSPFTWRIVERFPDAYELTDINVLPALLPSLSGRTRAPGQRTVLWFPDQHSHWVADAAAAPSARVFLEFSRFPAVRTEHAHGRVIVRWTDVRFGGGITRLRGRTPAIDAFGAVVQLDEQGRILHWKIGSR